MRVQAAFTRAVVAPSGIRGTAVGWPGEQSAGLGTATAVAVRVDPAGVRPPGSAGRTST